MTLFIWLAEKIATVSKAWLHPDQMAGRVPVAPAKPGSWYLLMMVPVVLVTLVHLSRPAPKE